MALSKQQSPSGPIWCLGNIVVATPGTPVNIMSLVDPNNNNAPGTFNGPGGTAGLGTTPTCHKIFFQAFHAGANNNGMVINSGTTYILQGPAGGAGNRSDSGAIVAILLPSGGSTWPAAEINGDTISPYGFWVDADTAGDGVQITLQIG